MSLVFLILKPLNSRNVLEAYDFFIAYQRKQRGTRLKTILYEKQKQSRCSFILAPAS